MKGIVWDQAPAGATHVHPGNDTYAPHWYKPGYFCVLGFELDGWVADAFDTDLSNHIPRPSAPWNGGGRPPVGTVCECRVKANAPWVKCEVVAHHKQYAIAYVDDDTVMLSSGIRFRPIKTQAQIEAETREAAIDEMIGKIKDHPHKYQSVSHFVQLKIQEDACADLYDAGYRKGESK